MCRKLGRRVLIDYGTYIRYPHKVIIGDDVAINRGCNFFPSFLNRESLIILKDRVVLGPQVTLYGAGQSPRERDLPDVAATITVESDVYIGGNSVVRYGVTIGEGAVVAAGSVVVKDVAPWTIVGGAPAKFISNRVIERT
jgi:acetyltransferase-like isoleucine patch superfamily enzyme